MINYEKRSKILQGFTRGKWWRPRDARSRYVYLASLESDDNALYNSALARLKFDITEENMDSRMNIALNLLESIKINEEAKEKNYIMEKQREFPELFGENTNWLSFDMVKKINEAIVGVEAFERRALYEKNRIEQRKKFEEFRNNGGVGKNPYEYKSSYTQSADKYAKSLVQAFSGGGRMQKKGQEIYKEIFRALGSSISLMSEEEIVVSANILNVSALQVLYGDSEEDYSMDNFMKNPAFANYFNLIQKAFEAYKEGDDSLWQQYQKLTKELSDQLGYTIVSEDKAKKITESNKILKGWAEANEELRSLATEKRKGIARVTVRTRGKKGMMAEVMSRLDQLDLTKMAMNTLGTGGSGTVTDSVILEGNFPATVTVDIGGDIIKKGDKLTTATNKISKIKRNSYKQRNNAYIRLYDNLEMQLQGEKEKLEELQHSFILHKNVKDYTTFGELKYEHDAFSGGSDLTLSGITDFIASLGNFFNKKDLKDIEFLLLNCVPGGIGEKNKPALEKFLSIFASMALFSDGATMAAEVARQMSANQSTLNAIHLYYVNSIYVPASYVMGMLLDELKAMSAETSLSTKAIKISIEGGIGNPRSELESLTRARIFGKDRWQTFMAREVASLHYSLKFLGGFLDILQGMFGA